MCQGVQVDFSGFYHGTDSGEQRRRDPVEHSKVAPPEYRLARLDLLLRPSAPSAYPRTHTLASPECWMVLPSALALSRRRCIALPERTSASTFCCVSLSPQQSSWCAHLARRSFTLQHGSRAAAEPPATYVGILNSIATSAYRGVMVFTSVVICFALRCIPYVGPTLSFVFFCWVDS